MIQRFKNWLGRRRTARAAEVLNRALAADSEAVRALFSHRVLCNKALGDDPTIQVRNYLAPSGGTGLSVGVLGLLNGILGADEDGWGYLCTMHDSVCNAGCRPGAGKNLSVGDVCPDCGDGLAPGPLLRFEVLKR